MTSLEERVRAVGEWCIRNPGQKAGVCVDDLPGNPERYKAKLQERFPQLVVELLGKGPVEGVYSLRVTLPGEPA